MSAALLSHELERLKGVAAEKQPVQLFNVLSTHYRNLALLDSAIITAQGSALLDDLIIALRAHGLHRAHRNLLGRCFVTILLRTDKSPFETANKILNLLQREKDEKFRWNATVVLGSIFENLGHQIVSLLGELVATLGRVVKAASSSPGLKAAVLHALGSALSATTKLDDVLHKEVSKVVKLYLNDKSVVTQVAAYNCLNELIICGEHHNEEQMQALILKNLEQSSYKAVRASAARCLASIHLKVLLLANNGEDTEAKNVEKMCQSLSGIYNKTLYKRVRSVVVVAYMELFSRMGPIWSTTYLDQLLISVLNDIQLALPQNDRHRMLTTRRHVHILLRKLSKSLDQEHQLRAVNLILNHIRTAPSRNILVSSLNEISDLIESLGSATPADLEIDPIYFLIPHPVLAVQVAVARTLKTIVLNVPVLLADMMTNTLDRLRSELNSFSAADESAKNMDCLGIALTLASLTSAGVARPLYISLDNTADQILNLANDTLKASAKSTINTAGIQVQVAWTLIGALQSLGPTFVRSHLSQLLLLWKNALPRPLHKDTKTGLDLLFLLHVRDTALSSVYAFLRNCRALCTADVMKRVSTMVSNSLAFLHVITIPRQGSSEDRLFNMSASELEARLRRRILACLVQIEKIGANDVEESGITALSAFADPRTTPNLPVGFTIIWECADNYAFGIVPRLKAMIEIDDLLEMPVLDALEHDHLHLYVPREDEQPAPAENQVSFLGVKLFALVFHKQGTQVQESLLSQMSTLMNSPAYARNPGRKVAVQINCLSALKDALSVDGLGVLSARVVSAINEILAEGLASSDQMIRDLAAESTGRLATMGGSAMTTGQVNELVDRIVKDRDPFIRAGCTTALGYIHKALGGIAAVYHLKSILNVLVSLAGDPHPVVHYHAIQALHMTIESSGLSFTAHTNSTLALVLRLYTSDVLDPEAGNAASSNLAIDLPHYHSLAQCADGLINIIGPDLDSNNVARELLLKFVGELLLEQDRQLVADGLVCTQHLALFAAKKLDLTSYIISLHYHLRSSNQAIQEATIDGLYQLMRVDASVVIRQSSITSRFDTALWSLLNSRPGWQTVKDIIHAWLSQTKHEFVYWIELFQQILVRQRLSETNKDSSAKTALVEQSVEDEGSALGNGTVGSDPADEKLRWQTRLFALECLHELVLSVSPESLGMRVGDLVRMAFSASTSKVVVLQVEGLRLLRSIISHFKDLRDPDFPESALLEQHQAQIGSALTPAFSADSSPDVAALAVHVCAEFIASGIVEDVTRMGRILRLLNVALDSCKDSETTDLFEAFRSFAENAKSMIRISVLSAWAELQVSSTEQQYLSEVVSPRLKELTPMWLESLKDYAQLRFEPTTSGNSMEVQYSTLSREAMVHFYDRAWLNLVHAIATLIDQDKEFVFDSLDNRTSEKNAGHIDYRGEPAAFFMVLFGICFEALARASMESSGNEDRNTEVLIALQSILKPSICGTIIYTEPIFTEIIDLFGRLLLTEGLATQIIIVDIAASIAQNHPLSSSAAGNLENPESDQLQEYVDQLFDLARLTILPLTIVFSWDQAENGRELLKVHTSLPRLARSCITHFVTLAEKFPSVIKLDLYNSLFHVFGNVLSSANTQATVVPAILPPFKEFTSNVANNLKTNVDDIGMIYGPVRYVLSKLVMTEVKSMVHLNNNILASAILLINLGSLLHGNDKAIPLFGSMVLRGMGQEECMKSANWAMKSLILTKDDQLVSIARQLVLQLSSSIIQGSAESSSALSLLFDFSNLHAPVSLDVLIPLLLFYNKTTQDSSSIRTTVAQRLLTLVSQMPTDFKSFVESLRQEDRESLQELVKLGMAATQVTKTETSGPRINLRMAFHPTEDEAE